MLCVKELTSVPASVHRCRGLLRRVGLLIDLVFLTIKQEMASSCCSAPSSSAVVDVVDTISLPNTYSTWPEISGHLSALSSKAESGPETFQRALEHDGETVSISLLDKVLGKAQYITEDHFYGTLLPWIADKALEVESLFKESDYSILNLHNGRCQEIQLSRQQVCCLMALAFFNTFKELPGSAHGAGGYQQFTFTGFLSFPFYTSQESKLICLLHYFERIRQAETNKEDTFLNVNIAFSRKQLPKASIEDPNTFWGQCDHPLVPFESLAEGLIEGANGCLQVDFANEYIGGGVLGMGNVQEEIRFVINPECLVSILFCQSMDHLESILITGAEQFSSYTGYGGRFQFTEPYNDPNPTDKFKRKQVNIVAIDATPFDFFTSAAQFQRNGINRELYKAYCGFIHKISMDDNESGENVPVATGNWGCGAFGGDKEMKTLLQWMAATKARRPVRYFTHNDERFAERQKIVTQFLLSKKVTVGRLYNVLVRGKTTIGDVWSYVMEAFDN